MKEKICLFLRVFCMTTLFVVSVSCGLFTKNAFADDKIITGAPGTCTVDVLGVSDESAFAKVIAVYQLQQYTCVPGTYLNKTETEFFCDDCPLNSYCPGGTFSVEDTYLGQNLCPENYITQSKNSVSQSDCVLDCDWDCSGTDCVPCLPSETDGFIVMTSLMNDGDEFKFDISAAGTYTIDWGDGNIETITKTNIANQTLAHKYEITGQFEIKISGSSTAYSTELPAISFQCKNNAGNYIVDHPLVGIGGSLGSVFSTIDGTKQPLFTKTFYGCETLSSQIPSGLFYGITGQPADYMFKQTFDGCSLLKSVPVNLFSGVSGTATGLFEGTFANTNLTGDITGLFAGIKGMPADYMFSETFLNTNLKVIPDSLFDGVKGETEGDVGKYMFENTFAGTGITAIPENLFSDMTPAEGMFYGAFSYTPITAIPQYLFLHVSGSPKPYLFAYAFKNTKITSIPPVLFDTISGSPAVSMFAGTFENCTELSGQIPAGLFKNIKGTSANTMFMKTFSGDEKLSSYIPPELFKGINAQEFRTGQMEDVFLGSGILEQCPADMVQYITGFEADFDSKVSCTFCPENSTVQGEAGSTYCECNDGYTVFGEINGATRVQYNQTCELPSVTIVYSCGNNATSDSVPPSGGRVVIGSDLTLPSGNTCKRDNYNFARWEIEGTGVTMVAGEVFPWDYVTSEKKTKVTLTAQYTPKNYNIIYSCDGTERNKAQNVKYGEEYILSDAICTKDGAVQIGWRKSDGQDVYPLNNKGIWTFDSDITLLAEFSSIYTITYDCGLEDNLGTTPPSPQTPILYQEEYMPKDYTCNTIPMGHTFGGWAVSGTDDIVQPGQFYNYNYTEDKQFSAVYIPNCNKITLNTTANGGDVYSLKAVYMKSPYDDDPDEGIVYSDEKCENILETLPTLPTKENAKFAGFGKTSDGVVHCVRESGNFSANWCRTATPTTWYAHYNCNEDKQGSGIDISGRCTGPLSTINYDCGLFGTGSATDQVETGTTYTIRSDVCTPDAGYGLSYYIIDALNTSVFPGDERVWTYTDTQTLKAMYQPGATIYYSCSLNTPTKGTNITQFVSGGLGNMYTVKSNDEACPCVKYYYVYDAETLVQYDRKESGGEVSPGAFSEYLYDGDVIFAPGAFEDGCFDWDTDEDEVEGGSFQLHITTENDNETVQLGISATGKFKIDWGSNEGADTIEWTDPGITYDHTYKRAGSYIITISGLATGYLQGETAFKVWCDPTREDRSGLYAVTGAMGSVFPTLSNGTQPSFMGTFQNCKQLKSIESVLFRGITGQPIPYMFAETFDNTALEEVPNGLFNGLSGKPVNGLFSATFRDSNAGNLQDSNLFAGIKGAPAEKLFMETFANTKLNGIPNGLFDSISGAPADYMFYKTFSNTNLGAIPTGLFKNISGGPAAHMFESTFESTKITTIPLGLFDGINNERAPAPSMFAYTFAGTPLEVIQYDLFKNIYGAPAQSMFAGTFANTDITSIPNGLFDGIDGVPAQSMFANTFAGTKITSIPYALFPKVVGAPAKEMYAGTFMNTPITYIPADLFAGIAGTPAPEMFKQTFDGCNKIAAQLPETLFFGIEGDLQEESFYKTFHGIVSSDFMYDTLNFVPPKLFDQDKINPDSATASNNAMRDIFQDSNLRGIGTTNFLGPVPRCPDTYRRVDTGFDSWFNTKTRTTYTWNDAINGGIKRACVKCPEHSNQRELDEYTCECDLGFSKDGEWSANEDNISLNRIISADDEICKPVTWNLIYECGTGGEGDNYEDKVTYLQPYTFLTNDVVGCDPKFGKLIGWQVKNQLYDDCEDYDCSVMFEPGEYMAQWPYAVNLPNIRLTAVYEPDFTIVTVPNTTSFAITIKADGKFLIDWGDGTRDTVGNPWSSVGWIYTHDYEAAKSYTIRISGEATAYANLDDAGKESVIDFYRADVTDGAYYSTDRIAEIYGSLGDIFPTLPDGTQPKFERVFENAINITSPIPENLFSGTPDKNGNFPVHGQVRRAMFAGAFRNSSIKAIPSGLFRSVSGTAEELFRDTFEYCQNLTSIPQDLFKTITGNAKAHMFEATFYNCTGLNTPIPSGLFPSGLIGATSDAPADHLFAYTFAECKNLPGSIPDGLFKNINSTSVAMFNGTFSGCENLSGPIPDDLFAGLSGAPKELIFSYTFSGCKNLTGPIPGNLFAGLSGAPAPYMFRETFFNCSSLTGQKDGIYAIPADLFAKISGDAQPYMFDGTFDGCGGLIGEIPGNLFENITGTPQEYMFRTTFANTNITKIGQGLFSGISGAPAEGMFAATFKNCRNIASQIPEDLFAGINGKLKRSSFNSTFENIGTQFNFKGNDNGCGIYQDDTYSFIPPKLFDNTRISGVTDSQSDMEDLFYNANLSYSCPTRYYRYITGFEDYFYGNVSCAICPDNAVQNPEENTTCICAPGYILREELREIQGDIAKTNTDCVVGEFKVFYDCNGGSGNPTPATIDIAYGAEFITAANTCEREGYDFAGWAVDKDTTNIKPENEKLEFIWTNNITLQAVWSPIITPVILDSAMYTSETEYESADTEAEPSRLWSEYLGGWYTDSDLTPESKIEKLTTLPRINGYLFRGFSQNKTLSQEDVETMYFVSDGSVKNSGAFGTTDEVTLHAHYKPCTCTNGEGVESCEVVGTNDNNQCIYEVTCAQYYIGDRTVLGQANIPSYTVTCDVAPLYTIKLDSLYYDSATDTEGALVTTNATPNTLYIKQNWGWFIDNSGVVPATDLTNIPVNDHFAFKGFYTGKAGTGTQVISSDGKLITTPTVLSAFASDATIYAYYEPQKYSISFDCGISSGKPHDTMLVTYGQVVNIPNDGACGGFICGKFMGWKISDTDLIIPKTDGLKWEYDTDKVLTAIYDTTYNIKYEANNERASGNAPESPVKCTEEAECLVPENTYYVYGNDFIGWSCTGNNECDNGIILQPGYNLNNFGTCYGDAITLIAQWKNSKFNIMYNPNGGSGDNPTLSSCEFGTECLVPENPYTYSGHNFVNWKYETDTNQSGLLEPNNDLGSLFSANPKTVTLTAQWNTISYNVVYHANGGTGTMDPSVFKYDEEYQLSLNKFDRAGYKFIGWSTTQEGTSVTYTDGQRVKNLTDIENGIINLYAIWGIAYTITFDKMGGTGGTDSVTVMYGEYPPEIETPTKEGYEFIGYYDNEDRTNALKYYEGNGTPSFPWNVASDGTLYAQYNPKIYQYKYDCGEGTGTAPDGGDIFYKHSFTFAENTCVAPNGYVFDKWSETDKGESWSAGESITWLYTDNKTFIATYVPGEYTVTFHSNYGEDRTVVETFVYDNAYVLHQQYRRTGSDFVGYATTPDGEVVYKDGAVVSNLTDVVGGNVDLYSIWEPFTTPFEYNGNGGIQVVYPIVPTTCSGDETCIAPENPFERPGYEFIGWTCFGHVFCDNGLFAPGTDLRSSIIETISKNEVITMTAQWKPITFTVVYDVDGGNPEIESQTCTYDTECFVSDITPTKPGYSFETWEYVDGANKDLISPSANITNITDVANATISLVAQYAPNTYTITYNANGGDGEMVPTTFTYGDTVTLASNTFVRDGYEFNGWATTTDGRVEYTDSQEISGLTGDITLYAVWTELAVQTYTITYNANGGNGTMEPTTFNYGTDVTLSPNAFTRDGYEFIGWATSTKGEKVYTDSQTISGLANNLELYAVWLVTQCTVTGYTPTTTLTGLETIENITTNSGGGIEKKSGVYYFKTSEGVALYNQGQEFTVDFSNGSITGTALCGPNGKSPYSDAGYIMNKLNAWQAGKGCWCRYGNSSDEVYTVTLDDGTTKTYPWGRANKGELATSIDACRAECPRVCAEKVATDSTFRQNLLLIDSECPPDNMISPCEPQEGYTTSYDKDTDECNYTPITYTVTYNANGGEGDMAVDTFTYDVAGILSPNTFTRTGYTFNGWAITADGEKVYNDEAEVLNWANTQGTNIDLYALWTPITYTVEYNANGGDGTMTPSIFTYDVSGNLRTNTFAHDGYEFIGWSTNSNASDAEYSNGAVVLNWANIDGTVITLYAVWQEKQVVPQGYTVVYSCGTAEGGTAPATTLVEYGTEFTPAANTCEKKCNTFIGWQISDTDIVTTSSFTWTYTTNKVLTAQWSEEECDEGGATTCDPSTCPTTNVTPISAIEATSASDLAAAKIIGPSISTSTPINNMAAYVEDQRWSVTFTNSGKTINGFAICGPKGRATNVAGHTTSGTKYLLAKKLTANQAYYGCYCKSGDNITDDTLYASAGLLGGNLTKPADLIDYCRAHCPAHCANLVATDAIYRKAMLADTTDSVCECNENSGDEECCEPNPDNETFKIHMYTDVYTKIGETDVTYNQPISGLLTPEQNDKVFVGWFDEGGVQYSNGDIYKKQTDTIVYARWEQAAIQYTVAYNANGGNGDMESSVFTYGVAGKLRPNTFTRTDYDFLGWARSSDATTPEYADQAEVIDWSNINGDIITLYAVWQEIPATYTITYHANGGTGEMAQSTFNMDVEYSLSLNEFTRDGYTFKHWATNSDGSGNTYTDGQNVTNLTTNRGANVDLYAVWQPKIYTITYMANGGLSADYSLNIEFGANMPNVDIPTPADGYVFTGYYLEPTGGTQYYDATGTPVSTYVVYNRTENLVLYAGWKVRACEPTGNYSPTSVLTDITTISELVDAEFMYLDSGANAYKFNAGGMAEYNKDQRFTFEYSDGVNTTTKYGTAFCGPNGSGDRTKLYYTTDKLSVYQTGKGCWCRYGLSDDEVYTATLDDGSTKTYPWQRAATSTNADTCRTECPMICAQYAATDEKFRTNLLNGDVVSCADNEIECPDQEGYTGTFNPETGQCDYTPNTYTITLDPDGGTTTQTSISVKYQGDIPNAEIPTYDGYLFMGYFTDRNGAGDKFFDEFGAPISSTYTLATDITVYAYWKVPACTDYDGSVLERCDDPIMSSQEMIDSGILEYKSTSEYKIKDFDKYMLNQKWAVNFPTYGEGTGTISGSAFCGPVNKAEYGTIVKSIEDLPLAGTTLKQAHAGCWCQVGPTDTTKFWVAAGKYDEGSTWAEKTDACRASCPDFCAQLVATDSEFRAKLYGGEDSCPVGTNYKKACCDGEYETADGTYEKCPDGTWCMNCQKNECDAEAMYTATNGATSPNACGTYLHVGDHKIFMRPNAKMTPLALHVNKRGTIFHANMSTEKPDDGKEKHLKTMVDGVIYYIYDNFLI